MRPLNLLRPAVRAQTVRYNRKLREGRGFTLGELKAAGINRKEARGVGIVVDHRRRNLSEEGKSLNVERLKAYKERLIVFPRKAGKPKKGDSTVSVVPFLSPCSSSQPFFVLQGDDLKAATTRIAPHLPEAYPAEQPRKITDAERQFNAFRTLRMARANQRNEGARKVRAAKVRLHMFCLTLNSLLTYTITITERGGGGSKEEVVYPLPSSFSYLLLLVSSQNLTEFTSI